MTASRSASSELAAVGQDLQEPVVLRVEAVVDDLPPLAERAARAFTSGLYSRCSYGGPRTGSIVSSGLSSRPPDSATKSSACSRNSRVAAGTSC